MRLASILTAFLLPAALSNGQFPTPGSGDQGSPLPPLVRAESKSPQPDLALRRTELLANLDSLIREAQTLRQEVSESRVQTVSAQSFKHSQKIDDFAKRIRKNLKD